MSLENLLVDKEYSITEAAEFLEVTDQTVGKCLKDGRLKGKKRGPRKKWAIPGQMIKNLWEIWYPK